MSKEERWDCLDTSVLWNGKMQQVFRRVAGLMAMGS